jgi:hypothetical protein
MARRSFRSDLDRIVDLGYFLPSRLPHTPRRSYMGWGDKRRSPKMKQRIRLRKFKDRVKRRRERLAAERKAAGG